MNQETYPLYILPATFVADKNVIRFRDVDGKFLDCHKNHDLIWSILESANGRLARQELVTVLDKKLPNYNSKEINEALDQLFLIGVLIDNIAVADVFHRYTNNPPIFSGRTLEADVSTYTKRPRMVVKEGISHIVSNNTKSAIAKLHKKRRTTRSFKDLPISFDELGHILTSAYSLSLHSVPSGGALYPLKIYAIVLKGSNGLSEGYYEYDPETHRIVLFNSKVNERHLMYALNDEELLGGAPVIVVVAGDIKRNQAKYGGRGYRLMLLEAGHVAQNIQLAAIEQNLGCFEYAGFHEDAVDRLLNINQSGSKQILPLITIGIGKPAKGSLVERQLNQTIAGLEDYLIGEDRPFESLGVVDLRGSWARHAFIKNRPDHYKGQSYAAGGTSESMQGAKIKALAEAYERHVSSHIRIDKETTANQLSAIREDWLDPRIVAPLTPDHFKENSFMQAFTENAILQWVKGKTVKTNRDVWVPIDLVFYPINTNRWNRKPLSLSSSSGVAAFTDKQIAAEKAFLELLERHCLMTLWHKRYKPNVLPSKLLPSYWREHIEQWIKRGRRVHILDISSGYGEVTLKVVITSKDFYPHYVCGAASSFTSFEHALQKAFQEVETAAETILHESPDSVLAPQEVKSVANHGEFYAHASNANKMNWSLQGERVLSLPAPNVSAQELFGKLDPVIIDVSPSDSPLCVVRVICKELLPIGFGFGNTHHLHQSLNGIVHSDSLKMPHDFA